MTYSNKSSEKHEVQGGLVKTMTTLSPPNIMPSHLLNIYEFNVYKQKH